VGMAQSSWMIPTRTPQAYTSDLSQVTGKGAQARQKAIDAVIAEDFPDLNLTYDPEYSPYIRTGIAQKDTSHHPMGSDKEALFYETIRRY